MFFGGRSERKLQRRLDCDKLSDPVDLPIFRSALASKLGLPAPQNINDNWSFIKNALSSAGLVSCRLTRRIVAPWISAASLDFLVALYSIPTDGEYNEIRLVTRNELVTDLRKDREVWLSKRALQTERAAVT